MAIGSIPLGDEFLVPPSAEPGVPARYSAVTELTDGGYVITWSSWVNGESYNVFAQRYDSNGAEIGAEFMVNTYTADVQYGVSITGLNDGGFLITWESYGQGSGVSGIYGQRYDVNSSAVGSEFQINTYDATGIIRNSEVTTLTDGSFVVTWESTGQDGVSAQRFGAFGNAIGSEFLIMQSINTIGDKAPSITALSDGGFVVTWDAYVSGTEKYNIFAQRFDANGVAIGLAITVNTAAGHWQSNSSTAALDDGGFVVVWHSDINQDGLSADGSGSQDGSSDGIFGQRFDANGDPVGGEFQINTYITDNQSQASVTGLADGGYVVTWQSEGQDGDGLGIYGQRYDADGVTVGVEFLVNTQTNGDSLRSEVAALENGGFVVSWSGWWVDDNGDHVNSIYAQQFTAQLFGTAGDDVMVDVVGADWLDGQAGDDILIGGTGHNILTGGSGADEFVFNTLDAANTITDFEVGVDTLNLQMLLEQAGTVQADLGEYSFYRIRDFTIGKLEDLDIQFVQNGADTEIYLVYSGALKSQTSADPLIVLEGVDVASLSFDDFIF